MRHVADVIVTVALDLVVSAWNRRYEGWVLPGGKYDKNKDRNMRETAARELFEESGLLVLPAHLLLVTKEFWISPDKEEHEISYFWASQVRGLLRGENGLPAPKVTEWNSFFSATVPACPFASEYKKLFPGGLGHFRTTEWIR